MKRLPLYFFLLFSLIYAQEQSCMYRTQQLLAHARRFSSNSYAQKLFAQSALKNCRSNLVKKNMAMIVRAWQLFNQTPGFAATIANLNKQTNGVHGYLFEIETALQAANTGEQVIALNQYVTAPDTQKKREFDLVTCNASGTKKFIECKNISWQSAPSRKKKQFREQAYIVQGYQELGMPACYIIKSKQPIPAKWKRWFSSNNIMYEENT